MMQRLLFGLMIFSASLTFAQVPLPPPPCGFFETLNICDEDKDDFVILNLRELFVFSNFCLASLDTVKEEDYNLIDYYLTENDMENETNVITNPESFGTNEKKLTFYFRANRTVSIGGSHDVLIRNREIEFFFPPSINQPSPIEVCDDESNDGIEFFDLSVRISEIIDVLTDFAVTYHYTLDDAENNNDSIVDITNFVNTITGAQTIYVRVEDSITGCFSITKLDLIVQFCPKGEIVLNVFFDEDKNGVFDDNEFYFSNGFFSYVKNDGFVTKYLYSSNGVFNIISDNENNTYDIIYHMQNNFDSCYDVVVTRLENVSVVNDSTVTFDFPIEKVLDCGDVAVYLISTLSPRPGFDYTNYLVIKNKGTDAVSGTIEFEMDNSLTSTHVFYGGTINSVTTTATGFNLGFINLDPNATETVKLGMNVPIPTPLGTVLLNSAKYTGSDINDQNNYAELSEVVIGSFDPNDILESHGPEIIHSEFPNTEYLYYTVRFQNVGTADAINVSIDNTLDNRLDKSTIQMLSSSHSNVFTRTDNHLNWQFDNIHLPSENMDEPNSHGYVYYKIKPLAGYSVGDIIPNTAEIYFDFNPAVITNTFETEFITTLSNTDFKDVKFSMFPNPAKHMVELRFNKTNDKAINTAIYDIQGKLILNSNNTLENSSIQLDISALKSGMYFLKVNDGINKLTQKLIIE